MKKRLRKGGKVVKGMPSAVVLSLLVHAALFLLAGMLVIFTVVRKEEQKFEPPQAVERPKMKLKKPKVQVKKTSKPRQTSKIVTKINKANMPEIKLPEMSGVGEGLAGGFGGFDLLPDLSGVASPFGSEISTGNDLEGHFYNFNRDRSGRKVPMDPDQMEDILYAFMKGGWKAYRLANIYRSPKTLYASTICVPTVMSEIAPEAFGEEGAEGYCWAVLYRGQLVYPEDITFRFWGVGDKAMGVQVDGKTVLICAYEADFRSRFSAIWQTKDPKDLTYYFGEQRARPSDWITLKGGEPKEIQVLMADKQGGLVYHMLSVEVQGETYPNTRAGGGPTFPVFRTSELSLDQMDVIYQNLYPGDLSLTNGPIFRDYGPSTETFEAAESTPQAPAAKPEDDNPMRVWTSTSGKTVEGVFRTVMGTEAILEGPNRKQLRIPINQLSEADLTYIELATPPRFDMNFSSKDTVRPNPPLSPFLSGDQRPLQMFNYVFGAKVKQVSSGEYNHNITVEYFAIGEEVAGKNFVLLDRQERTFIPTKENKGILEFYGDEVLVMRMANRATSPMRGTKYGGFLITITDERGKVIQHKASNEFLFDNLENLRKLAPNNYFNRECIRVRPTQPTEDSRGAGATDLNV